MKTKSTNKCISLDNSLMTWCIHQAEKKNKPFSTYVAEILTRHKQLYNNSSLESLKELHKEKNELVVKTNNEMKEIETIIKELETREKLCSFGKHPTERMVIETKLMKNDIVKNAIMQLVSINDDADLTTRCIEISDKLKNDNPKMYGWMIADVIKRDIIPKLRSKENADNKVV